MRIVCFCKEDILPDGHYYDLRRWKSRGVDIVSFQYLVEGLLLSLMSVTCICGLNFPRYAFCVRFECVLQ
jgi:hypothetical protein